MAEKEQIITPEFILRFSSVFETKKEKKGGVTSDTGKYGITMLFDKEVIKANPALFADIKRICLEAAKAKFGSTPDGKPKVGPGFKYPWVDGDTVKFVQGVNAGKLKTEKYPEFAGKIVMSAMSMYQPGVVDNNVQD